MRGGGAAADPEHQTVFSEGHSPQLAAEVFLSALLPLLVTAFRLGADPSLLSVPLVCVGPLPFPTCDLVT